MTRQDLVGVSRERSVARGHQPSVSPASEQTGRELAETVRQAAREIEAASYSAPRGDWAEYQLPHGYNRTRVVLLVRDPYWLHCYWEVGSAERETFRASTGREYQDMDGVLRIRDLTAEDDRDHCLEVGVGREARSWYLEAGRPGHTFQAELGVNLPGQGFICLARSNTVTAPPDSAADLLDEDWMVVEEEFRRLYRLGAGVGPGNSSVELMESLTRRLARQMGSGAVSSLGSGFRLPAGERRFWLVVGTELIVYGATEPEASVTVDGLPVSMRPDGTFSTRFALPDGERSIPVSGVSPDGRECVTITPFVRKETH